MIKLGSAMLGAGRPVVAVSFTDVDNVDDIERARAAGVGIAELRIDLFARQELAYVVAQVKRLAGLPTLATVRMAAEGGSWKGDEAQRLAVFEAVLPLVDAVDVELQAVDVLKKILPVARGMGKPVVVSHHNFEQTPPFEALAEVARHAAGIGADIVKIAANVLVDDDIGVLSRLLAEKVVPNLVVIGMGEKGLPTRLMFPGQGSLFTFAAKGDRSSAPGQLSYEKTLKLLAELGRTA